MSYHAKRKELHDAEYTICTLGIKRAKPGRPPKPRGTLEDLEQVMTVLDLMRAGMSQESAVGDAAGDTSREDTLARKVRRYRGIGKFMLDDEAVPFFRNLLDTPSAPDDFQGLPLPQ